MTNQNINLITQNPQSTVVTNFTPTPRKATGYQSEDALEKEFVAQLRILQRKTSDF